MSVTVTDPMSLALEEARRALGRVSPNPAVGAVLVKDGRVVGRGHTQPPGGPHAEIVALREAAQAAHGASLYVTLEPCCHHGRTPPCVQAVIRAGVREVVIPLLDPNPLVSGRGRHELRAAGVRVRLERRYAVAAAELIEAFTKWVTLGRPFVIAKYAMTLDGRVASASGDARWVSGEASRRRVQELRSQVDAVLVGRGTVLRDDPSLTVRLEGYAGRQPLRVILDSRARLPLASKLASDGLQERTVVVTDPAAPGDRVRALEARGLRTLALSPSPRGVDLASLLERLGREEITSLLVEGGPTVLGSFFLAGLVDKVVVFVAPKLLGDGPPPLLGPGAQTMAEGLRLERTRVATVGQDVLVTGYVPQAWQPWASPGQLGFRPTMRSA